MQDYTEYIKMDFKKTYKCPYKENDVGKCWSCQEFDYCVNRKQILNEANIVNLEYTSNGPNWLLCEPKGTFDPGRFIISDGYIASSFLGSSSCRKRSYSD